MKGITFKPDLIRAILDNRKTVTRRLVKPQPDVVSSENNPLLYVEHEFLRDGRVVTESHPPDNPEWRYVKRIRRPYSPGETVYVKEGWSPWADDATRETISPADACLYRSDYRDGTDAATIGGTRWRSPMILPARLARTFLHVTDVRCERVQEITHEDAIAEGVQGMEAPLRDDRPASPLTVPQHVFAHLWDQIHPDHPFDSNPFVWRIAFSVVSRTGPAGLPATGLPDHAPTSDTAPQEVSHE